MPVIQLKNHKNEQIIYSGLFANIRECLEQAVAENICLDHMDLRHANLINANLDDACMRYARLDSANLMGANISKANLDGAVVLPASEHSVHDRLLCGDFGCQGDDG